VIITIAITDIVEGNSPSLWIERGKDLRMKNPDIKGKTTTKMIVLNMGKKAIGTFVPASTRVIRGVSTGHSSVDNAVSDTE
jgi:hypothetical protein